MKPLIKVIVINLIVLFLATFAITAEVDDPIFRAMDDELERSMNSLVIEDMPKPYFLSYRVQDTETVTVKARYSALVRTEQEQNRYLYIDLRVGDISLDNSNYVSSWRDVYKQREGMVEEDDYSSLRHQIWLSTDEAYKSALSNLAGKKAYLQTHPSDTDLGDFVDVESLVEIGEPVSLDVDLSGWERTVRLLAERFRNYSNLQDWSVEIDFIASNRRYLNSEGSRHLQGAVNGILSVSATIQAEDGGRLTGFVRHVVRDEELPPIETLIESIGKMASELTAVAAAPTLEEYAGPVMFTDFAAAQFISQLFVSQLSLVRKPVVANEYMSRLLSVGRLTGRINRRVLPDFVSVYDKPGIKNYQGQNLAGYQVVDDEGVKCRELTLVKEGRLVDLPMSRLPHKKINASNGHAATLLNQWTLPRITNLFVNPDKPKSMKSMTGELRKLCRDFGNEYGLLITLLDDPQISSSYRWTEEDMEDTPILTSPVLMYRVYEDDGRIEPVRGLVFDEVTIRNLRDIVAMGKDAKGYNILQKTVFQHLMYPTTIVVPSILVEEIELKGGQQREPLPLSDNPLTLER